jgi:hypothetical protein
MINAISIISLLSYVFCQEEVPTDGPGGPPCHVYAVCVTNVKQNWP